MPALFLVLILILASPPLTRADGLSGRLTAGLLVLDQADNQNGRGHALLTSREARAESTSRLLPVPLLELRYTRGEESIVLGSPVDDPVGLSVAWRRGLAPGALTGSLFYSGFGREWQDPYLVGTPRSETRVRTYGGRVGVESVGGTPLQVGLKGTVRRIEDEGLTGELRRDGARLDLEAGWRQRLGGGWALTPQVTYQRGVYRGEANSFHGGGLGLTADWRSGELLVSTRVSGSLARYDRIHPLFGQTRRDRGYRLGTTLLRDKLFGRPDLFATLTVAHQQTDSRFDFFSSRTTALLAGIGYAF
jgi:hypothetical protein